MKETTFIEQNKRKWAKFEKLSKHDKNDPDEVSELFTEITEDLSYARTFYPRRSVRVYLNQLAQGVFTKLYKQKKQRLSGFVDFWVEKVPLELYRARKSMLAAVVFFLLSIFLGAVSQHYDSSFVNLILGEWYVEMTEEFIKEGNPMGVYGTQGEVGMFFQITINNIKVAFFTFVLGIFASLGTYLMLLNNGIMLGTFQWWFKAKGLLLASFLAVWIHGAFEISSIVIAGGAGITVGNGLLFPNSYTRIQSLVFSAKRGLRIMLSLVPLFIIAGTLESFVTRHYLTMSSPLKWTIILGSFLIIILYYGVYPFIVAKKYPKKIKAEEQPRHIPERKIDLYKIRTSGQIFSDSIYMFLNKIGVITNLFFKIVFPFIVILSSWIIYNNQNSLNLILDWNYLMNEFFGTGFNLNFINLISWSFILSLLTLISFFVTDINTKKYTVIDFLKFALKPFVWMFMYATLIASFLMFFNWLLILIIGILIGPILASIPAIIAIEKKDFFTAFGKSFSFEKGSYGLGLANIVLFMSITIIFFLILHNPMELSLIAILDDFLKQTLIIGVEKYMLVINIINISIYILFLGLMFVLFFFSFNLYYYSNNEKKTAKGLYKRLSLFGERNRSFETESDFE